MKISPTFMTMNHTPTRKTDFENSVYLNQRSIDPNTLLPPCTLSIRNKNPKIKEELKFPASPAFVSIYKMNKDIKLQQAEDFCTEKNIPFSSEEHNFYQLGQNRLRFKQYAHSVNKCFETSRPSEFTIGCNLLSSKKGPPNPSKVSKEFADMRLYVPHVF